MLALIFCEFRFHLLAVARDLSNLLRFFAAAIFGHWNIGRFQRNPAPISAEGQRIGAAVLLVCVSLSG
jgi:hypothetical protein